MRLDRFSRPRRLHASSLSLLVATASAAFALLPPRRPSAPASPRVETVTREVTPWPGEIEARVVAVPPPADVAQPSDCITAQEAWRFEGSDLGALDALLRRANLADEVRRAIVGGTRCDARGCSVTPSPWISDALTPAARAVIYPELARHAANRLHAAPELRPFELGPWAEMPGLSNRAADLLARSTWSVRGHYAFSDLAWVCARLSSPEERAAVPRALLTRSTLEGWVRARSRDDIDAMVAHWGVGREAEVRRAFEQSYARRGRVSLTSLLPPMARALAGRHAPRAVESDGFWTAAHFLDRDVRPERMGADEMRARLDARYVEAPLLAGRFGDVVALYDSVGALVQTASLVALDIVFVKDGDDRADPWVLERLGSLLARHRGSTPRLWRLR